ncbi:hypothetical protein PoB_007464900 [Plakobranchus ocellatus]|uniref:Uncharacterized protein n=1 Tax=Plakobranchus ocellatus TaxID=259542 RepID=A0AAV4DV84_9GAST|nr:hypothetical protein PoB_007464900 [Plakobranchus ocellatus]
MSEKEAKKSSNDGALGEFHEATSFHKELLKAEKAFEKNNKKPSGKYDSKWNTGINDRTIKDPEGNVTCISEQTTQMSSSYSYSKSESGCSIQ